VSLYRAANNKKANSMTEKKKESSSIAKSYFEKKTERLCIASILE
jgi:hypothetical protein